MRKNRLIALIGTLTMAAAGIAVVSVGSNVVKEAKADTGHTVYFAPGSVDLGSYTNVRTNYNKGGDPNEWGKNMMTLDTSHTYHGRKVYSGEYWEKYGGVDAFYFDIMDYPNTWDDGNIKVQTQAAASWMTNDQLDGKIYTNSINGAGTKTWATATFDTSSSATIYFAPSDSWIVDGKVWLNTNQEEDTSGTWKNYEMEATGEYYDGRQIYSASFTAPGVYTMQFLTGSNKDKNAINIISNTWTSSFSTFNNKLWSNSTSGSWISYPSNPSSTSSTYYLYNVDHDDVSWTPYAYYWQQGFLNEKWPGVAMTDLGNHLYSVEISNSYTNVIFNNNGGDKTDDQSLTNHTGGCFDLWKSKTTYNNQNGAWNSEGAPYFVNYNANTGSGNAPSQGTGRVSGTKVSAASGNGLSKSGYEFLGWSESSSATTPTFEVGDEVSSSTPGAVIELYAVWKLNQKDVTISFDTNGGNETISPISGKSGAEYNKPTNPTKSNCTFAGWNPVLPDVLPDSDTTYNALWTVNDGTYLTGSFVSPSFNRDGAYPMEKNASSSSDTQYVLKNVTLAAGGKVKVYYANEGTLSWQGEKGEGDPTAHSSQSAYPVSIDTEKNLVVTNAGTYDIYFDTTTRQYHTKEVNHLDDGYYFVVTRAATSTTEYIYANEVSGYTGTEYSETISLAKDDSIRVYHQGGSDAGTVYDATMNESVKVWDYIENTGLICPEAGAYTLYLINSGSGYDKISIFEEGEELAANYASTFLETVAGDCDIEDGKESNLEALAEDWETLATAYNSDPLDTKSRKLLTIATKTFGNETLAHFAKSYDYIYCKYGSDLELEDFAHRYEVGGAGENLFSSSKQLISINDVSTSTWIIATVAIVGVAAVGVFFIYRKRKEN